LLCFRALFIFRFYSHFQCPLVRWGIFLNFSFLGQGLESSFAGFGCALALCDLQMCLKVC
jgi:hypothetical protein